MMVTVEGSVFEALLSNMVPGKTYQVTVSSVKGLEESDPSTDTVTTGRLSLVLSCLCFLLTPLPGNFTRLSCVWQLWTDRKA